MKDCNKPVPSTVSVQCLMTLFGQAIENTFYYQFSGAVDESQLPIIGATFLASWNANVIPVLSEDVLMRGALVTDISNPIGGEAFLSDPGETGGFASPSLPGGSTLAVKRLSAFRGRSTRGRVFIPGIPSSIVTGNTVSRSWGDELVTALNNLKASMESMGSPLLTEVVVSRITDGLCRATPLLFTIERYALVNYDIDSQRRRLAGRGA